MKALGVAAGCALASRVVYALLFADQEQNFLYKSTDGGATWSVMGTTPLAAGSDQLRRRFKLPR